jgi:hypothetical protein
MIRKLLGLFNISSKQNINREFLRHALLALLLVAATLATSAHVHAKAPSNSSDYLYEDCEAFHHNSTDYALPESLEFDIAF